MNPWPHLLHCIFLSALLVDVPAASWTDKLDHGSLQGFPTFNEANALLDEFVTQSSQQLVKQQIGTSFEKRPIYAYILGTREGRLRRPPQTLLTALTHAREPAGLTVLLYFLGHMLDKFRNGDPDAVYVLENREIWFVPFVNPDGYVANQGLRSKVIRKNRRPTCRDSTKGGVDINRNFAEHWSSSFGGCDEEHGGTKPFSEPETQALKKICEENNFKTAMNFHAFGEMLTHPYNWATRESLPLDDSAVYKEIAKVFRFPTFGPAIKTVGYTASGESDDWMYGVRHIISMSPEVGPESGGFWPSKRLIAGIDTRNFDRTLYVVLKAGMELQVEWSQTARGGALPPGPASLSGGLPANLLQLRISNRGLSSTAGQALGVAVQGAIRSGAASGLSDKSSAVVAEAGLPVGATLMPESEPVVAFKVQPIARRSQRNLQLFVSRMLEPERGQTRTLLVCVAEVHNTASPFDGVVCHCSGPSKLPTVGSEGHWQSDRESFKLPSKALAGDATSKLCAHAANATAPAPPPVAASSAAASPEAAVSPPVAVEAPAVQVPAAEIVQRNSPTESPPQIPVAQPPVVQPPVAQLPVARQPESEPPVHTAPLPLPVMSAASVPAGVASTPKAVVDDGTMGTMVLLVMGITALCMGACLLTQTFVKTRTSVARRAPSASDFERIPGLKVPSRAEDSDDLGFSPPSKV